MEVNDYLDSVRFVGYGGLLFSLYTSDCKTIRENSNDILVKYADDKCLTGLISKNDERAYCEEIGKLSTWCNANYLELNMKKTKEIIVDFRKKKNKHYHHSCCKMKMCSV